MNKNQAIKEVRDVIIKHMFLEIEKMKGYKINISDSECVERLSFGLYNRNFDPIILIEIALEDCFIRIYHCTDSLYKCLVNYDNFKFKIITENRNEKN